MVQVLALETHQKLKFLKACMQECGFQSLVLTVLVVAATEPGMKGREQAQRDPFSTLSSAASSGVPELYRSPYQSRAPAHQASFPSSNGSFGDFLSAQPREMSGNLGLGVGAADEDEFGGFETAPGGSLGGFGGSPGLGGSYGTSYAASYGSPNGYGSGAGSLVGRPQSGNGPIPLDVFGVDEESMAEAAFLDMDSTALEDALHGELKEPSTVSQCLHYCPS